VTSPAVVIRFELERRPVVYVDALHEEDELRLRDWLDNGRPDLGALIDAAIELADETRQAA
jgi:hypothetical protein